MLDILQFVFTDFWHWLGCLMLLATVTFPLGMMFKGIVLIDQHQRTINNAPEKKKEVS